MTDLSHVENQVLRVTSFQELVSTPFKGEINAICWVRELNGNFSEIVEQVKLNENITELNRHELNQLELSQQGHLAREILLNDFNLLEAHGASPVLNLIKCYERDNSSPFFPTDVYSFHVDRSPVPTDTFLCTYHGEPSDILPNSHATKKILIPEIREKLRELYQGPKDHFESFLSDHFLDLHYQAKPKAHPISLGQGHMWRLAIDHPESQVSPCLHRAPKEKNGESRLLMIC